MPSQKVLREEAPLCVFNLADEVWQVSGYSRDVSGVKVSARVDHMTSFYDTDTRQTIRYVYIVYNMHLSVPRRHYMFHSVALDKAIATAVLEYLRVHNYRVFGTDKFKFTCNSVIYPEG